MIHMEAKVSAQAKENLLGVPSIGNAGVSNGAKKDGVVVISKVSKFRVTKSVARGQKPFSAKGERCPGQRPPPGLGLTVPVRVE